MLRRAIPGAIVLVAASLGLFAPSAAAATERPLAEVKILPIARLAAGGAAITVKVRTLCQSSDVIMWEGYLGVTQGDTGGSRDLLPICNGHQHVQNLVVPVHDSTVNAFERGQVTVSVVIVDENNGLEILASDTESVKLR